MIFKKNKKVLMMGGFEGGDEGGFWDVENHPSWIDNKNKTLKIKKKEKIYIEIGDSSYQIKAYAKINMSLKITEFDVYDTITFVPCVCDSFTIEGCDGIPLELNTIYKAYHALNNLDVIDFFCEHKVVVTKKIPLHSGLGGASSDAGAFLRLAKEVCNLILSTQELIDIGTTIGKDVPFFIYNYPSTKEVLL